MKGWAEQKQYRLGPIPFVIQSVYNLNVICTGAFFPLSNSIFDRLAFIQVVVAGALYRGVVKEQIAPITFDEAKTFVCQFLDFTLWHCCVPLKKILPSHPPFNAKDPLERIWSSGPQN
jgi:hypothetical protein